ncbi:MAG: TonB-dependent receptor [Bryobacterales bacterium]|nr:TonB-dependent receptor [Bryobacteraceae bacterium]MDW8130500.1 TonB-dependent receptor [Bryobacterales bacterium]
MRARNFAALFCIAGLTCVPAQNGVQGVVVDPSGGAIAGARVECGGRSARTAADGRFFISGPERCLARVEAPGFETRTVEIVGSAAVRVELPVAALAERIVVSATRRETPLEEAGLAGDVFTRADLAARQFPNLGDLLRELPGVHVTRYGRHGSLTQVFTRGGQRTATLVLLDDMPLNDPGGEVNLATLSTAFLDRVETVRAPASVLYGAEASSGVVQLVTRRGDPHRRLPHARLAYERGSFSTDRWTAALSGGAGARLDYSLGAEQFRTTGEFPNDFYRNTYGTASFGLRLAPSTEVRAVLRGGDAILGTPNQVGYGIVNYDARQWTRDWLASFRLDDARGQRFAQRARFGHHRLRDLYIDNGVGGPYRLAALVRDVTHPVRRVYLIRLLDPDFPDAQAPPGTRIVRTQYMFFPMDPYLWRSWRTRAGYEGTLSGADGAAIFGYEYERQGGHVTGRDVARDHHGLFAYRQQTIAGRLFLSGGLRVERSSAFGTRWIPRAAASFRLAGERGLLSGALVRLAAGRGITEPSLVQNYARDPWFVGNPALRPEKTASFEAGLVGTWFGRRLRTELAVFDNSFRDLIVFVFLPFPDPSTWRNIEASRARGAEVSAQARLIPSLLVSGQYTRLRSRITQSSSPNSLFTGLGQELPRRPGNSGALTLCWTPRTFLFQAGAVLVGERQDNDLFGVTRNPGYQSVYGGLSWRTRWGLAPYLRVENLLNARYHEVLGYSNLSRAIYGGVRLEW